MAEEYVGNIIPAPGFYRDNTSTDDELLASTARFTQKGVTLRAGQGVLPLGTIIERQSDKTWTAAGSGVVGYPLRRGVDTGTDANGKRYQGNIVISGILKYDRVKNASVSGWATAMGARVDTNLNIVVL